MRNTKLPKAIIFLWIFLSLLLLSWRLATSYDNELFFFYLFFAVLFIHIGYGAFKFVDFLSISFGVQELFLNALIFLLLFLIAYSFPNLALEFFLLSLLFILVIGIYYLSIKRTRKNAYKNYALEKIKAECWAILLFLLLAAFIAISNLKLITGIVLFIGELLFIMWLVFIRKVYAVKNQ